MTADKRFLVDVGMRDLPFPMRVASRDYPGGQPTVASISIVAQIWHEFEAGWISKFIQLVHRHRDNVGTESLRGNIMSYLTELGATTVAISFAYPFFVEKRTPVSNEKCLVKYDCAYSVKILEIDKESRCRFRIEVPIITTYPSSAPDKPGGLFGQLTIVHMEIDSAGDVYPEDLVELVDRHGLAPVYSFLTEDDQAAMIERIHSEAKSSVLVVDEIKNELAHRRDVEWYSVRCANYGMIHSYSTVVRTEKSIWVPFSGYEGDEI